ncbi:MAG: hypothetical protein E7178_04800 [Erysipelotrichaceae bacterium]|jgi:hypothetical protein|nr:hypothetical protein [Erysipelotrichaceae bacterium]
MKYRILNEIDCQFIIENKTLVSYAGNRSNVTVPDCVEIIGKKAFKDNLDIRSLNLNKVVEVGEDAFSGCKNLKHVILPNSLKLIEQCAFSDISNSKLVIFDGTLEQYNKILKGEPFAKVICDDGVYSQSNIDVF